MRHAEYFGTATKIEEKPINIIVKYEIVPEVKEKNVLLPVAGGIGSIIIIVLFFLNGNVTVFNYKNNKWKKVGKVKIKRNNTVNLSRFSIIENTNKYKLVFSKKATRKVKGKLVTYVKNNTTKQMLANVNNEDVYTVEIRI